jgi:hypothetical protein
MSTIFSLSYTSTQRTGDGGYLVANRGKSGTRLRKGKIKMPVITKSAPNQGGGHAEEIYTIIAENLD